MSREERRGLPGFVPGPMAADWSEEDCDFILTRKARDFVDGHLKENPKNPFFLVLGLSFPHNPRLVQAAMKGKSREGPNGDLVTIVDWPVGQIADLLEKRGLTSKTLLIVTSDNGAMRGAARHKSESDFRGYKGAGRAATGFRSSTAGREPGTVSSETISLIDIFATCAVIVGTPLPDDAAEDSWNVLSAIPGRSDGRPLHEALIFNSGNGVLAIRQGRRKLIAGTKDGRQRKDEGEPEDRIVGQLYDFGEGPGGKNDLFDKHPEIVMSMTELLDKDKAQGRSRLLRGGIPAAKSLLA